MKKRGNRSLYEYAERYLAGKLRSPITGELISPLNTVGEKKVNSVPTNFGYRCAVRPKLYPWPNARTEARLSEIDVKKYPTLHAYLTAIAAKQKAIRDKESSQGV